MENGVRHGDGLVMVTATRLPAGGEYDGVLLTVDDEGEGIAVEIRQRVFTKFWQHGVRGGSGLGMYLVNGLVRAHGGTVEILDSPSGGARIALDLAGRGPAPGLTRAPAPAAEGQTRSPGAPGRS